MDEPTRIPLKEKYTCPKTRGKHKGGEHAAPRHKRNKTGKKNYVYGSRVMVVSPTGKTTMREGEVG
jgi:hypothetical protein